MNRIICLLTLLLFTFGLGNSQSKSGANIVAIQSEHDFGTIKEANGKVTHTFVVKNTGTTPLVITRIVPACGCTTPEYSSEPIAPGKERKIVVTFDPLGLPGAFVKSIAVFSNGKDGALILRIKGKVE